MMPHIENVADNIWAEQEDKADYDEAIFPLLKLQVNSNS